MIVITGVAGFIGSNLAEKLLKSGEKIFGIDNFITGNKENIKALEKYNKFSFIKGDIVDSKLWEKINNEIKYNDQIYHLACPTGVPNCKILGIEMLKTSVFGTKNVLEFARKKNAKILFTSSSESYGDPKVFPQKEDYWGNVDPVGFRSPYEEGKRCGESLVMSYSKVYKIDTVIARIFNTYGLKMSRSDSRVIPRFIHQALSKKPLTIYNNGEQTRTFSYISDTVQALVLLMKKGKKGQVYNVGSGQEITIKNLAMLIKKLTSSGSFIVYKNVSIPDHKRRLPDVTKIKNLGWRPIVTLNDGLIKTIKEWKK